MADWRPIWLARERRTGKLVRACYVRRLQGKTPTADQLHALCRLTWITKGADDIADNTHSVVTPALSTLLNLDLASSDPNSLGTELRAEGIPEDICQPASGGVGFVNFYAAFRNTSRDWIAQNKQTIWAVFQAVAEATTDDEVRHAYAQVEALPPLPRRNAGDMPCFNLLTPVLACLDRRERSPIINSREDVKRRLARLGLSNATLVEQYVGLKGLIGQAGIDGAFALDTASEEAIEKALKKAGGGKPRPKLAPTAGKPLAERHDDDLEYLRSTDLVAMRKRHNRMTNALRTICEKLRLVVEEGSEQTCLFDALVRAYQGTERHLLIEVKTETSPPFCRMAVGQLLDYRRHLPDAAAIDLAVLLPEKPPKEAADFFGYVGVSVLWLNSNLSDIEGTVRLGKFPG